MDSVVVHKTSGQFPKGRAQQRNSFKMDVFMTRESLNFSPLSLDRILLDHWIIQLLYCRITYYIIFLLHVTTSVNDIFIENFRASFLYITKNLNLYIFLYLSVCYVNFAQKVFDIKSLFFFNLVLCMH